MNAGHQTMTLLGYEPLTEEPTGFCTGLFTARGKTNEVFIPVASIEGDGTSTVASFMPVIPKNAIWLSGSDNKSSLTVGEVWKDVLLVNGDMYFGTRQELKAWVGRPSIDDLLRDYPFTAIHLMRDIPGPDRQKAVKAAYKRISGTLTREDADAWAVETYLRGQIQTHLRRQLTYRNASPLALEALRNIEVERNSGEKTIAFNLPGFQDFNPEDVEPLLTLSDDRKALKLLSELPSPYSRYRLQGHIENGKLVSQYRPRPVLVIPIGGDGELVARLLMEDAGRAPMTLNYNWPDRLFEKARPAGFGSYDLDQFSLVVVLVDDVLSKRDQSELEHLKWIAKRDHLRSLLIVPVLPTSRPSNHLWPDGQRNMFDGNGGYLRLDTSVVRSPLYWGDRTLSLGRRTVGLLVQACLLLLSKPETLSRFLRAAERDPDTCLTVTFLEDKLAGERRFAPLSEAIASHDDHHRLCELGEIRPADNVTQRRRPAPAGLYELSARRFRTGGIWDLAAAAIGRVLEHYGMGNAPAEVEDGSSPFNSGLQFPELVAIARVDLKQDVRLLVTAEAPSLQTLAVSERAGMQAVRYSDVATLRRIFLYARDHPTKFIVPDDILPLKVPRQSKSNFVFRRPDQEPGVLVTQTDWQAWVQRFPHHPLVPRGRTIISLRANNLFDRSLLVALSEQDMLVAANEGGSAYRALQDIALDKKFTGTSRLVLDDDYDRKKIGRWVIRSGRFPIIPRPLPPDCTVGEGWITFDGDQYAAVVVASHVFALWLRIHGGVGPVPSQTRWTDDVLNAFPWPDGFVRVDGHAIFCSEPTEALEDACASVVFEALHPRFRDPSPGALSREIHPDHRDEITNAVLTMYDFPKTKSEVSIIRNLVEYSQIRS